MVFLHAHGVATARVLRIHKTYGDEAVCCPLPTPLFRAEQGAAMSLARLGGRRQETSAALGGADQVTVGIGPGGS